MTKLLNKYETRIKNFVLKLSESPYLLKKYNGVYRQKSQSPIPNSHTFYQEKAFSFKKYKSDRERINEILEKNTKLEEYYKKMNEEKERLKKMYQIKFAPKLIQPNMHFQYKSGESIISKKLSKKIKELETKAKSADSYNTEENYDENENNNDNLTNTYSNDMTKRFDTNTTKSDFSLTEEQIRRRNLHNKIIEDRKNMINTRKLLMNLEGGNAEKRNYKYSLGEIYRKTEFKAMENLKMFKTSIMNTPILKKWKKEDEEKQINIKLNNLFYLTEGNNSSYSNKKVMTRNNKSQTKFLTNNINTMNDSNSNQKLKKIYSMDEFNINNNDVYSKINNNKDIYNFNIIKEKPHIEKRRVKLSEDKKILNNFNISKEISHKNPLLYKLYFLDIKSKENNIGINEEQFNQIKKMAFIEKKSNVYITSNENEKLEEDLQNEELANLFNKHKKKKLSVDQLAEKILDETNYNLKNKYKSKYDDFLS